MSHCCPCFIGLGSNLDEPERQLSRALDELEQAKVEVCHLSSLYRTEPVGPAFQPWFLNRVAGVRFDAPPEELLRRCQSVERRHGRTREVPNGPRTLDLDLLLFGDVLWDSPDLTLPHPRLAERRFVLVPLNEIAPDVIDPRSGLSIRELLSRCEDRAVVERLD